MAGGKQKDTGASANADRAAAADAVEPVPVSSTASIPSADELHIEIIEMWVRLARQTRDIVKDSGDWAGEEPKQTAMVIEWAELAEQCFWRAVSALASLPAAQAIEARQRRDRETGLDPKGESAVGKADAPKAK